VLPFRFGTTLPDRAAAEALLQKDGEQFRRQLAELRGRVELAVRVALPPEETAQASADGAGYLAARARAERAREQLLAPLESAALASAKREAGAASVVSASYLVRRDEVDQFTSLVRELQEHHPELALSCTGPWAPYSFVGERP
jgi:nucleoid-associated protein YgaU